MPAQPATSRSDFFVALQESLIRHTRAHRRSILGLPADADPDVDASALGPDALKKKLAAGIPAEQGILSSTVDWILGGLERLPRPYLNLGFKVVASYHFFGITGILLAAALSWLLAYASGLSVQTILMLQLVALVLSALYLGLTLLLTRKDAVVFFNYFLTVMAGEWLALRILGQPVLPYLDVLVTGSGMLFAFGRVGCFMAGCCYGRPAPHGIRYDLYHRKNGFPRLFRRVKLIPVQLIEALWLCIVTGVSSVVLLLSRAPGAALATFVLLLGLGRIILEIYRGDPARPYYAGLSQAQWTSAGLVAGIVCAQLTGLLPFLFWHSFILACFFILLVTLLLPSTRFSLLSLNSAHHVHELVNYLGVLNNGSEIPHPTKTSVYLKKTSSNIQMSMEKVESKGGSVQHLSVSFTERPLKKREVLRVSRVIQAMDPSTSAPLLIADNDNVYHLIYFDTDPIN